MKLSIIVPIYNVAAYLRKCVDSLLAQDISDYEIILVDDGSTDGSSEIADAIQSEVKGERLEVKGEDNGKAETSASTPSGGPDKVRDFVGCSYTLRSTPSIRVIHQKNAGLSAARNSGIKVAQGNYILFVDSDDYLQPNTLGTLLEQTERDNLDVLRFRYQNVKESGEVFVPHEGMKSDYNDYSSNPTNGLAFLNEKMWVQCYVVQFLVKADIVRRELFTPGIYFEDVDWTPRMLLRAKRVASTDLVVYNYLWREGSITLSQKDIAKMRKQLHNKLALIGKLNTLGKSVACRRWFDGMISGLVINIVGIIASTFYSERKQYIKQINALNILPITTYHIAPRAQRKVKLINLSINFAVWLLHIKS